MQSTEVENCWFALQKGLIHLWGTFKGLFVEKLKGAIS